MHHSLCRSVPTADYEWRKISFFLGGDFVKSVGVKCHLLAWMDGSRQLHSRGYCTLLLPFVGHGAVMDWRHGQLGIRPTGDGGAVTDGVCVCPIMCSDRFYVSFVAFH